MHTYKYIGYKFYLFNILIKRAINTLKYMRGLITSPKGGLSEILKCANPLKIN